MADKAKFRLKGKGRDSYVALVVDFPLASIKSEGHCVQAQRVMDELLARDALDKGEAMYLDALSDLVAAYEDVHHPIESASDADMLRYFMDQKAVTPTQLSDNTGIAKSTISEIMNGKKAFSRQIIRKLAAYFHVDVGVLAANI